VEGPSLTAACISAFGVVFVVLAFLALVIHVIGLVLPARAPRSDPVLVAAIAAAVAMQQPGARVVRIVEEK
jgi:hypothetical protein